MHQTERYVKTKMKSFYYYKITCDWDVWMDRQKKMENEDLAIRQIFMSNTKEAA